MFGLNMLIKCCSDAYCAINELNIGNHNHGVSRLFQFHAHKANIKLNIHSFEINRLNFDTKTSSLFTIWSSWIDTDFQYGFTNVHTHFHTICSKAKLTLNHLWSFLSN